MRIMPSDDLTNFLRRWPFEPGCANARITELDDGRRVLQVRLELGALQFELDGRPDGNPSLLDSARDVQVPGTLDRDVCRQLREEAIQRSHRAQALVVVGEWSSAIDDATVTLELLDLCRDRGVDARDREALEPFRGSLIAMRARAGAEASMESGAADAAMAALDAGLAELRAALGSRAEGSNEAVLLAGMRDTLVPRLPSSQRVDLQERLRAALSAENYELAAILRDELRQMPDA